MLWRRTEAKDLPAILPGDKKEAVLRQLAFTMMARHTGQLERSEIISEFRPLLRRFADSPDPDALLEDLTSNGLLVEREQLLYCFAHHTFQEYLASAHIRDKSLVNVLADAVNDPWWRETTLLYAARADTDPLVDACLASKSIAALSLAFDCAREGGSLSAERRARLDQWLSRAGDPHASQPLRDLAAALLLEQHLRESVDTHDGSGRLCLRPLPSRLYRQFLRAAGKAHDVVGDEEDERAAALGLSSAQALTFLAWANDVFAGERVCRLPVAEDLEHPDVRRALREQGTRAGTALCVWLRGPTPQARPALWVPPQIDHPLEVSARRMAHRFLSDLQDTRLAHALTHLRTTLVARALLAAEHPTVRRELAHLDKELDAALLRLGTALTGEQDFADALERERQRAKHRSGPPTGRDISDPEPNPAVTRLLALDRAHALLPAARPLPPGTRQQLRALTAKSGLTQDPAYAALWACVITLEAYARRVAARGAAPAASSALAAQLLAGPQAPGTALEPYTGARERGRQAAKRPHVLGALRTHPWLPARRSQTPGQAGSLERSLVDIAEGELFLALHALVGGTLAGALHTNGAGTRTPAQSHAQIGLAIARAAHLDSSSVYAVVPELLGLQATAVAGAFGRVETESPAAVWLAEACVRFGRAVGGQDDPDAQSADRDLAALRVAALCLAAEADDANVKVLGDRFRHIAAGTVIAQDRSNGLSKPCETLILAFD